MNGIPILLLLMTVAYLGASIAILWELAVWAQSKHHPAWLAAALAVTLASVALVVYAFTGTVPFPQRRPWEASLAHALLPLIWLLPLLPFALCVAMGQTCLRLAAGPGIARWMSFVSGFLMTYIVPLALLGSAQGLAGASL